MSTFMFFFGNRQNLDTNQTDGVFIQQCLFGFYEGFLSHTVSGMCRI